MSDEEVLEMLFDVAVILGCFAVFAIFSAVALVGIAVSDSYINLV